MPWDSEDRYPVSRCFKVHQKNQQMPSKSSVEPANRSYVVEIDPSVSQKVLGPGSFGRVGTIGEGSCFFHSLCYVTNRDNYAFQSYDDQLKIAHNFRCTTFKERFTEDEYKKLKKTVPNYEKTYEELIEGFCKPNVWADEIMIKFACKLLGYNILFLDFTSSNMYCNVVSQDALDAVHAEQDINQNTILVGWVSRSHFEPIVKIVDPKQGRIRTVFNGYLDPNDKVTIDYILKNMASECNLKVKTKAG